MVRRPSVTGTADEASFAPFLAALLRESPAFQDRPNDVWLLDVPGGRHARACVLALVRGRDAGGGGETVLLTGHFDTVSITNYGPLQPLACDPDALLPALLQTLEARSGEASADLARRDLASGQFVPGRGLLDMKAGLAAALVTLEHFAAEPRRGNLLFLAVPDEEANSVGARAAAAALAGIAQARGLYLSAAINLDAIGDHGDGEAGRTVTLGTVGKLCPSALVIGQPVHACYAFDGINAASLAGALASDIEWSPRLTERSGHEQGAGPTLLGMKDDRIAYDVTMPGSVWLYWNVITHDRRPAEILATVAELTRDSMDRLCMQLQQRRQVSMQQARPLKPVRVMTYEDMLSGLLRTHPEAATGISARMASLAVTGLDLPEQCRLLTLFVAEAAAIQGPAIVLGFASMPYLTTRLQAPHLERAVSHAVATVSDRHDIDIGVSERFPAICDMSLIGQADRTELAPVAANMPVWSSDLDFVVAGIPCINAGPWGRDYHTRLERMHRHYGYTVLPDLVATLARNLLDAAAAHADTSRADGT